MGSLYDYAKSGCRELPAAAGEVRGADVPVPAAALEAGDGHQAAKFLCANGYAGCAAEYLAGGTCQRLRSRCALEGKR